MIDVLGNVSRMPALMAQTMTEAPSVIEDQDAQGSRETATYKKIEDLTVAKRIRILHVLLDHIDDIGDVLEKLHARGPADREEIFNSVMRDIHGQKISPKLQSDLNAIAARIQHTLRIKDAVLEESGPMAESSMTAGSKSANREDSSWRKETSKLGKLIKPKAPPSNFMRQGSLKNLKGRKKKGKRK